MDIKITVSVKNDAGETLIMHLHDDNSLSVHIGNDLPGSEEAKFKMDPESARSFLLAIHHTYNV